MIPTLQEDNPLAFDADSIAAIVRHKHGINLTPDDPAFLLVTINQLVLQGVLEEFDSRIAQIIGHAHQEMDDMRTHAAAELGKSVRTSALVIRQEIQADIDAAKIETRKLVDDIQQSHSQVNNRRWLAAGMVAAATLLSVGVAAGYALEKWGI